MLEVLEVLGVLELVLTCTCSSSSAPRIAPNSSVLQKSFTYR